MKSPWKTLGLADGAPAAECKAAYRALARRLHPDVNGGSAEKTERFKRVTAAYEELESAGFDVARVTVAQKIPATPRAGGPSAPVNPFFVAAAEMVGDDFDRLVDRVGKEGITTNNIDDLVRDFAGMAKKVHQRAPEVMKARAEGVKDMGPSELFKAAMDMFGGGVKPKAKK